MSKAIAPRSSKSQVRKAENNGVAVRATHALDRETAEVMMRHVDAIDLHLGAILEIVHQHVPPGTTRKLLSDGAFRAVNEMHTKIARPITRTFPDLDIDLRTEKRKSGPKPNRRS